MMTAFTAYNMIQFLKSKVSFCPVHFSRNSCNISLKMAGFSANGAWPASSTISSTEFSIVCPNNFECSTGIKLSFLPHMIRERISLISFNRCRPICVVVLFRNADSKACFAPGLLILFMKTSTNIGNTLQDWATNCSNTFFSFSGDALTAASRYSFSKGVGLSRGGRICPECRTPYPKSANFCIFHGPEGMISLKEFECRKY